MPLPRFPGLRGKGCSSNCWGSGARSCRGEVAEAVSGGNEIEIAPMVADVTASRFHVMGVGGGLNVSWKKFVYDAVEWVDYAGHIYHASHRYSGCNGQFVVRSIVPLQRYERGYELPHPRPLYSSRVISSTRGGS